MKMLVALLAGLSLVLQPLSAPAAWAQEARPVRPGDDFDTYANAAWRDSLPASSGNASVTAFSQLRDLSRQRVFELVSDLDASDDPDAGRLAALNTSFMDTERVEAPCLPRSPPRLTGKP